ncbi:hypothetical protein FRB93_005404 [Tulasnella sp. JGI-2019a]|nr:hypothetical protein FRB93_005404 [Tulasnella sp. JGI-2019a]
MFIPTKVMSVFLAFATVGFTSPTPGPELAVPSAPDNTIKINSVTDFCMIVPREAHTNIGDSEHPGGMQSYCSHPTDASQGQMPNNFWIEPAMKIGEGVNGKTYVQLTGCINPSTLDRLDPNDTGGQYDSSGGANKLKNPALSTCIGYAHYVELIEPASNLACIRCCQDPDDCRTNGDTLGCKVVIPADYPSSC